MAEQQAEQSAFDLGDDGKLNVNEVILLTDIETRQPDNSEIWYGHTVMTSTLFPSANPAPGTDFVSKTSGSFEYMLEAGVGPERKREFPYGKYPRLLMAWMAKQIRAAKNKKNEYADPANRTITIPSIYQLCEEIGVPRGGRTAEAVQDQLRRLLSCRISIRRKTGFADRTVNDTAYLPIVEAVRDAEDQSGWAGASFKLSEQVWAILANESAPFDFRASNYLLARRSVLPYDVYIWLTTTMFRLRRPQTFSWDWLYERYGDQIQNKYKFRTVFKHALEKVLKAYPAARVDIAGRGEGIIVYPSPPSVPPATHGKEVES